jgi:hypothetical protein
VGAPAETSGPQSNGKKIDALFCDTHVEGMTFDTNASPAPGSFKDYQSNPLGLKHWDPTK